MEDGVVNNSYIRFRCPEELKQEFKELVGEGEMSRVLVWMMKWYIQEATKEEKERVDE